ncbi:CotY/CotZ family spore coat protein [Salsuginibacillus kocurii]|uniref:CotY/CotZ family spore coat protein n=1 Tax=Salsuginibacillus kocurii TaxID=427078 RepID=UPI00036B9376|nr:CotY/CotZ family spore coat protein [Salsuginibacillus kocurii]
MSCGKDFKSGNCVCDAVLAIHEAQKAVQKKGECVNSCFQNLLKPNGRPLDTTPFMLKGKDGKPFWATGGLTAKTDIPFNTIFFRVEHVDEDDCCATLSLLRPDPAIAFKDKCCVDPDSILAVTSLERTEFCVEVDLSCFCAIQCLDPELVG